MALRSRGRPRQTVAVLALVCVTGAAGAADLPEGAVKTKLLSRTAGSALVVGHRGGGCFAPENTLRAIELGLEMGADIVELDVRLTSDGYFVLLHDETVDDTTNGSGEVANLAYSEVSGLKVKFRPAFYVDRLLFPVPPDSPTFKRLRIPTLSEALEALRGKAPATLHPKTRVSDSGGIARLVADQGMLGDVAFLVGNVQEGKAVLAAAPDAILIARPKTERQLDRMLMKLHPAVVHLDGNLFEPRIVGRVKASGAAVWMNAMAGADLTSLSASGLAARLKRLTGSDLGLRRKGLRGYRDLIDGGADLIQTDNIPDAALAAHPRL